MQRYKALICDVDGTLIPLKRDGMPSEAVTAAVQQASKRIHVGVATSRPYHIIHHIVSHLHLHGPSIIHGGAQIVDLAERKVYREHPITKTEIQQIYSITKALGHQVYADNPQDSYIVDDTSTFDSPILGSVVLSLTPAQADELSRELSTIPTISVHKIPSWKPGTIDVSMGATLATKQHGIE